MITPAQGAATGYGAPEEPALRFFVANRLIGLSNRRDYLRALLGLAIGVGAPALVVPPLAYLRRKRALHVTARLWARCVVRHLQIDLDCGGLEQINPQVSYMVIPLHESFADVLALLHLPLGLRFAVRDELFNWRLLGSYLRLTEQICVCPERPRWSYRRLLRTAQEIIAAGESLVIFPQGTILGIETDFLPGAFALAKQLRLPLLPVALSGGHRVWEHPYTPRLRFRQRLSLRVLPPLSVDAVAETNVEEMRVTLRRQLKAVALEGAMAPPRRFVPARDGYWDGFAYRIDPDFPALAEEVARHRASISLTSA